MSTHPLQKGRYSAMKRYIAEGLEQYLSQDMKPWHMPGHKRKGIGIPLDDIYQFDITEIPGVDDLHNPEGMILKSEQQLAEIYDTFASYYMVNGATGGVLSAVGAVANYIKTISVEDNAEQCLEKAVKDSIIIARNCHKSVYNACEIFGLKPIYLEPEYIDLGDDFTSHIYGAVTAKQIKSVVEANPDVVAVVITSPTYEGVISDIASIKTVLQSYNIPLIVDEAHGAHLPFISELPRSAVSFGADIVVQSLHKTLPALTQTAIIHVNNQELNKQLRKYLSIFMSSSPSYPMLCSMEEAVVSSYERKNENRYETYIESIRSFRTSVSSLENIKLLGVVQAKSIYDDSRIVFYSHQSGEYLAARLREVGNIEVEMSGTNYVVLISTYMDEPEEFMHLEKIIKLLDEEFGRDKVRNKSCEEATFSKEELYKLVGTVAEDNIFVYPPGSYIVAAKEEITKEAIDKIIELKASGKRIIGL